MGNFSRLEGAVEFLRQSDHAERLCRDPVPVYSLPLVLVPDHINGSVTIDINEMIVRPLVDVHDNPVDISRVPPRRSVDVYQGNY